MIRADVQDDSCIMCQPTMQTWMAQHLLLYVDIGLCIYIPLWSCFFRTLSLHIGDTDLKLSDKMRVAGHMWEVQHRIGTEVLCVDADNDTTKADGEQSKPAQAETNDPPQDSKTSSKAGNKASKNSKQENEAKKRERTSDKGKKNDKGRSKGKKRDMDDLKSKLPPDLQGKVFDMSDMKDMDMDSLKAKIEAMKLEKQGDLCSVCMQAGWFCCTCQHVVCLAYVCSS